MKNHYFLSLHFWLSAFAYFVQLFGVVAGYQKQDIRAHVLRHGVVVAHNLAVVH